jgi:hypothetical protein
MRSLYAVSSVTVYDIDDMLQLVRTMQFIKRLNQRDR